MSRHPRLALVVAPRLLGDTLARALRDAGIDVIQVDEASAASAAVDVAVITGDVTVAINAPVVLTLPTEETHGVGTIRRGDAEEPIDLPDVEALLRTLRDHGRT